MDNSISVEAIEQPAPQCTPSRSRRKANHTHSMYEERPLLVAAHTEIQTGNDTPSNVNPSLQGSGLPVRNLATAFAALAPVASAESRNPGTENVHPYSAATPGSSASNMRNDRITRVSANRNNQFRKGKAIHTVVDDPRSRCFTADTAINRTQEHSCGSFTFKCQHCSALLFRGERRGGRYNKCCYGGKVVLPRGSPYPQEMKDLLTALTSTARKFREMIRVYNNAFAFASFTHGSIKAPGAGMQTYNVHGQTYHRISSLHPASSTPSFAQLYIYDSATANEQRIAYAERSSMQQANRRQKVDKDIMDMLDTIIRSINPYVRAYQMMREVEEKESQEAAAENRPIKEVSMWIGDTRKHHPRRYNAPTCNEVAVVFTGKDGEPPSNRQVAVHSRNGALRCMHYTNPSLDPMVYPLLFPHGDWGWNYSLTVDMTETSTSHHDQQGVQDIEDAEMDSSSDSECEDDAENGGGRRNSSKITQMMFYSSKCHIREGDDDENFNPIFFSERLFSQYSCDGYTKVEASRMNYFRNQQKKLRAEKYHGLRDYINSEAERRGLKAGTAVILPSSFTAGPRALQQLYQDAMSIVRVHGKPDYFITFTCNPKWKEITDNCKFGQQALDRPDLVIRVFKQKVRMFLDDIMKKHVLGKVKAMIGTYEFQKRGLPHFHVLLIMDEDDKPDSVEMVDSVVSAEIPSKEDHPQLYDLVLKHMIHGPCGSANPTSPCMVNNACTKEFPKAFNSVTSIAGDCFAKSRRRDNSGEGHFVGSDAQKRAVSNAWVVQYNPYFLLRYNAHINVEICSSVKSVKYIFKYIHKGHDRAVVILNEKGVPASGEAQCQSVFTVDEIKTHVDTRYVCAPESLWRIYAYKMHERSHAVYRLAVHQDLEQSVVFVEGSEREALEKAKSKHSHLTAWFELNKSDVIARQYKYAEIPEHYVFQKYAANNDGKKGKWTKRKRAAKIVTRIFNTSPKDIELYCLRLLLLHVKGCENYDDIRTFNGVVYSTFKEAAQQRQLLKSDECWKDTLQDACGFHMPQQLRQLFATICVFGNPTNALELWESFKEQLAEDFTRQEGFSADDALNLALAELEDYLRSMGMSLSKFELPQPQHVQDRPSEHYDLGEQQELAETYLEKLNGNQKLAIAQILSAISKRTGLTVPECLLDSIASDGDAENNCYFVDGPGGTGKTFLYNTLMAIIRGQGRSVIPVAQTGIAASLLVGGRTAHSRFGLPLTLHETSVSNIKPGSIQARELLAADCIIWDEISMTHHHALDTLDRLLRDLTGVDKPFGNFVIILGGDFRQQLPVVKHGNRIDIVNACVKSSALWEHFQRGTYRLVQNMRTNQDDRQFAAWLLKLGNGNIPAVENEEDDIQIPQEFLLQSAGSRHPIVDFIFGPSINATDFNMYCNKAILSPLNEDSLKINEKILSRIEGEKRTFLSVDEALCDEAEEVVYAVEFLNSLTPGGLPPHALNLKIGCIIILLRNLNPKIGLCNGTRLAVHRITRNALDCEIIAGKFSGNRAFIPRIQLAPNDPDLPFTLSRTQFPVRLGFCLTINKSQGQTLEKVGVYLPKPVFTHGQLYTACSRVTSKSGLKIQIVKGKNDKSPDTVTKNIVYKEILG